jgi:hypothetical protein
MFRTYWKNWTKILSSVAGLLALGAMLHGGATAYASADRVAKLEVRTQCVEVSQARIEERLQSVDEKLDLAIRLLGGTP